MKPLTRAQMKRAAMGRRELTPKMRAFREFLVLVSRAAHTIVRRAVESGELTRSAKCERCNKRRQTEAHHDDYTKPLVVVWLCKECHGKTWTKPRLQLKPKKKGGWPPPMQPTRAKREKHERTAR